MAGLELLALAPDWIRLLVVGAAAGVAVGLLLIAAEKAVSKCKQNQDLSYLILIYYSLTKGEQVISTKDFVTVDDLEKWFNSKSFEKTQYEFRAKLLKEGFKDNEIDINLNILKGRLELVSTLFKQTRVEFEATPDLLVLPVSQIILKLEKVSSLSIEAYEILIEVVESYWEYCSAETRRLFISKAQEILSLSLKEKEAQDIPSVVPTEVVKVVPKQKINPVTGKIYSSDEITQENEKIGLLVNQSLIFLVELYNTYVGLALRFAYCVFGNASRDEDKDYLKDLEVAKYLFEFDKLATSYKFVNPLEISEFINKDNQSEILKNVLSKAASKVLEYFNAGEVNGIRLELFNFVDAYEEQILVIYICSSLETELAYEKLISFQEDIWIEFTKRLLSKLSIDIVYDV